MSLEISHASPIEFWLTGQESFNQKEECSIYPVCFCQTIASTDTLRLDIIDTNDNTNYLYIYLDDGSLWKNYSFSSTGFDHHQYILIIGANGDWADVINRKLIFKITSQAVFLNSTFQTSLSPWFQSTPDSNHQAWVWSSNGVIISDGTTIVFHSTFLGQSVNGNWPAGNYTVNIVGNNQSTGPDPRINISVFSSNDGLGTQTFLAGEISYTIPSGAFNKSYSFTLASPVQIIAIQTGADSGSASSFKTTINSFSITSGPNDILAQSDCVDIIGVSNTPDQVILSPTLWSNITLGSPSNFTKNATTLTANTNGFLNTTFKAKQPLRITSGVNVIFPITILGGGSWGGLVTIVFSDGDPDIIVNPPSTLQSFSGLTSGITYNETVNVTLSHDCTHILISVPFPITGSNEDITITLPVGQIILPGITGIEDTTICTKLISYSNSTDIAGLGFPSSSPSSIYYLRIPAVFFEEQYPQEQEDLELSTDEIITLWSKMEAKKLLDIGFMPFYMHKKLQLILMMDYISIDGIEYRKRDPYTISEGGSKRHALRRAQVLLSEKDFITRNLL